MYSLEKENKLFDTIQLLFWNGLQDTSNSYNENFHLNVKF